MRNSKQQKVLNKIGQAIYKQRKKLGYSRTEIAIELNTDEKQIRRIENGEVNTTIISLLKISVILNIDIKELVNIKVTKDFLEEL